MATVLPFVVSCSSTSPSTTTPPTTSPAPPVITPPTEPENPSDPIPPDQPETPIPPTEPENPSEPIPPQPETPIPPESNVIDLNKELGIDKDLAIGDLDFYNIFNNKPNEEKASFKIKYLENNRIKRKSVIYKLPLKDAKFRLILNNFQNNFHDYLDEESQSSYIEMSRLAIQLKTKYNYEFNLEINNPDIVKFDINNNEKIYIKNTLMQLRPEYTVIPATNIKIFINNIDMSGTVTQRTLDKYIPPVYNKDLFAEYEIRKLPGKEEELDIEVVAQSKDHDNNRFDLYFNHKTDILLITDYLMANVTLKSASINDLKIFATDLVDLTITGDKEQYQLIRNSNIPQNELSYLYKPSNDFLKTIPLTEDEYKKMYSLANAFKGNNRLEWIKYSNKKIVKNIKTKKMFVSENYWVWNYEYDINTQSLDNPNLESNNVWTKIDYIILYSYNVKSGGKYSSITLWNSSPPTLSLSLLDFSADQWWQRDKDRMSIEYFKTWLQDENATSEGFNFSFIR